MHRSGKGKDGEPRPILTRFLRYKDAQKIFSLGHRLKYTDYQMFPDYPAEIVKRRKEQMKTFKEARKNGIPEAFSPSQPDKLYIRGRLWPVGRELTFSKVVRNSFMARANWVLISKPNLARAVDAHAQILILSCRNFGVFTTLIAHICASARWIFFIFSVITRINWLHT